MSQKTLGPNLCRWELRLRRCHYVQHRDCGGLIGQLLRRRQTARHRWMVPVGRPRCSRCLRLVGKKTWRGLSDKGDAGLLKWASGAASIAAAGESAHQARPYLLLLVPDSDSHLDAEIITTLRELRELDDLVDRERREVVEIEAPRSAAKHLLSGTDMAAVEDLQVLRDSNPVWSGEIDNFTKTYLRLTKAKKGRTSAEFKVYKAKDSTTSGRIP